MKSFDQTKRTGQFAFANKHKRESKLYNEYVFEWHAFKKFEINAYLDVLQGGLYKKYFECIQHNIFAINLYNTK